LDYALTVSNGRGPAEAIFDLDNNKGIGLRLKTSYEMDNFSASLGGYLYAGMYTDESKGVYGSTASNAALDITRKITNRYQELSGSLDLTLELYGLRLQGEYARQQRQYKVRPPIIFSVFNIADPSGGHSPDSLSWFTYALAAYKIPVTIAGLEMAFIPFTLYEYNRIDYAYPKMKIRGFRFGLDFKPSPFLIVKYESVSMSLAGAAMPIMKAVTTNYWFHSGQVAVSF
jgi:hypothetical protein